ncbi:MAG TPA: hypothetical protein VF456_10055 [Vicinamibacterales bacterium]
MAGLIPRALAALTALTLSADVGFAQDKPDFSGSWVLASGPSDADVPRALSIQQLVLRTTVRGEPMTPFFSDITITRTLAAGTSSETFKIGVIGGSVTGGVVGGRIPGTTPRVVTRTHSRVFWDESTLVIESGRFTGPAPETGDWSERRELLSFTPNGGLLLEMESRSSTSDRKTIVATYRRE